MQKGWRTIKQSINGPQAKFLTLMLEWENIKTSTWEKVRLLDHEKQIWFYDGPQNVSDCWKLIWKKKTLQLNWTFKKWYQWSRTLKKHPDQRC